MLRLMTVLGAGFFAAGAAGELRMWTNADGRTVNGELVNVDAKSAVLRIDDKKDVPVPLASLSEKDLEYIEGWKKSHWKLAVRSVRPFRQMQSSERMIARGSSGFTYLAVEVSLVPPEEPGASVVPHTDFQLKIVKGDEEHLIIPRDFGKKGNVSTVGGPSGQYFIPMAEVSASGEIREAGGKIAFESFEPLTPGKEYRGWIYFSIVPDFKATTIEFRKQPSLPVRMN